MQQLVIVAIVSLVVLAAVALWLVRRRRLPPARCTVLWGQFARAEAQADPNRRVLDAEKVLDATLRELGHNGSMADKLKSAGPAIGNLDAVWRAHKLRNRIAHEPDVHLDERAASEATQAFARALKGFLGPRP